MNVATSTIEYEETTVKLSIDIVIHVTMHINRLSENMDRSVKCMHGCHIDQCLG